MARDRDAAEKILREPVTTSFCDDALKVGRNLLIDRFVIMFSAWLKIRINPSQTALGFKLVGLYPVLLKFTSDAGLPATAMSPSGNEAPTT